MAVIGAEVNRSHGDTPKSTPRGSRISFRDAVVCPAASYYETRWSMRTRDVAPVVLFSFFLLGGCDQPSVAGRTPAEPTPSSLTPGPLPAQPANTPNWKADATVTSAARGSAAPCGWGTSVGDTRNAVQWRIAVSADAISLDEDTPNWPTDDLPYSGHLAGAQFTATYASASNYADFVCQFREATISGTFTSDSTFEAEETLVWGRPSSETSVKRHWHGSRL
jgi:hypothetical protein